jgi:hypothetical protein
VHKDANLSESGLRLFEKAKNVRNQEFHAFALIRLHCTAPRWHWKARADAAIEERMVFVP